jgi:hypothetical protein
MSKDSKRSKPSLNGESYLPSSPVLVPGSDSDESLGIYRIRIIVKLTLYDLELF